MSQVFILPSWAAIWLPYLLLVLAVWLAYWEMVSTLKGPCSDDLQGIFAYDGRLQRPISVGNIIKKLRYEVGKAPNPNRNWKADKQPAFLPHPVRHHRLNLIVMSGFIAFLYSFLSRIFGEHLAFFAVLLYVCHPLGTQTVAWMSGINYLIGAFFALVGLNFAQLSYDLHWLVTPEGTLLCMVVYGLIHWLAVETIFMTLGTVAILVWLGWYPYAIVAGLLAVYIGIHTFKEAVVLRRNTFRDQAMDACTKLNQRKIIVVLKSLAYYTRFVCWSKHCGLYAVYGYHYELPYFESEDSFTWWGVAIVIAFGTAFWFGTPLVQFAILWYLAYIILFLNWITANQMFTERYSWLPALAPCLILAAYAPVWLYWMILGIALMRTWAHLDTYNNETQFYLSNLSNFPNSEIALGNLGVTYLSRGLVGTAVESWLMGTRMNPEYDVNWYNLAQALKSRGPMNPNYVPLIIEVIPRELITQAFSDPLRSHIHLARYCLNRAVTARTCHFKTIWEKELAEMDAILKQPVPATLPAGAVAVVALETSPVATSSRVVTTVANVS